MQYKPTSAATSLRISAVTPSIPRRLTFAGTRAETPKFRCVRLLLRSSAPASSTIVGCGGWLGPGRAVARQPVAYSDDQPVAYSDDQEEQEP